MANSVSMTKATKGNNSKAGVMPMLDKLHTQQVEWNNTLYKASNDGLFAMLGECLEAYKLLQLDRTACKLLNARLEALGLAAKEGTHLTTRVVRYVFRIANSRAAAYARVLRAAVDHKVEPLKLKLWVIEQGGIEAVRRLNKGGATPAQRAKQLTEDAGSALVSAKALASIDKLPAGLKPGAEAYEGFKLVLLRHNKQTGAGEIVWASENAALTKRFLAVVGEEVLTKHKTSKAQSTATSKRAAQAAAIAAPVAANDSGKKIAA